MTNLILEGVVGSTAYNLAHENSDIDKKGIFAFDTKDLFSINYKNLNDVKATTDPDNTWYEAARYCSLALKCNPNILELLYLSEYTVKTDLGEMLREIRSDFLSAPAIRGAYINYARSQLHEIEKKGHFGSDLKKRTEKHARHLVRLMMQGFQLYSTGELTVALDNVSAMQVKAIGFMAGQGDLLVLRSVYEAYKEAFDTTETVLPDEPRRDRVESWLKYVRQRFL